MKKVRERYVTGDNLSLDDCTGLLRSAYNDLQTGMLSDIRHLALAEVFDDLLEMAQYLADEGYQLPAAAIAGAVLEDTLRKLTAKHGVAWTGSSGISKLNTALYTNSVYDKAQSGQVEAWGKLRNKVDHGDFKDPAEVNVNDVRRMIEGVRDFIVKYL
jgi:DNA-binding protein Fis